MANNRKRPSRLGRGLSSLMAQSVPATPPAEGETGIVTEVAASPSGPVSEAEPEPEAEADGNAAEAGTTAPAESAASGEPAEAALSYIPVGQLRPNPHQPRQAFDEASLGRLAESIRSDGLMQPIVVRPAAEEKGRSDDGPAYDIVAGERRWRAACLAELAHVPAIVRELDDQALAEWALIENLQREDLNPIERAEAFSRLAERFGLGHDEIARRVGLERSTISNLLRLLQLSDDVKQYVSDGSLSMGQARAIAGVPDAGRQQQLAERAIKQGLSVRQVEQLARQAASGEGAAEQGNASSEPSRRQVRSAYLADLEQQLAEQLQTRVKVRPGRKKGSGTLTIEFYSLDQFDALLEKLGVQAE